MTTFFEEDFEDETLDKWVTTGAPQNSAEQNHTPAGSRSCKTVSADATEFITKTWGAPESGYMVEVWFYDIHTIVNDARSVVNCFDSVTTCLIGVNTDEQANNYIYRIGGAWFNTGIARTTGWHKFQFDYRNGTDCVGYIDDAEIFDVGDPDTFDVLQMGCFWAASDGIGYWDDIEIRSDLEELGCGFDIRVWPYEKMLTEYTLVDEDADVTRHKEYKISWDVMRRDAETYLWKDYDAGHFRDFEFYFDIDITFVNAGDVTSASVLGICTLSNVLGVMDDINGGDTLFIALAQNAAVDDQYKFYIRQFDGGVSQFIETSGVYTIAQGVLYGVFSRKGTTVTLRMYSDASRETLVFSLSSAAAVLDTYRYFMPISNWGRDVDPANTQSGTLENVKIGGNQELACGFEVGLQAGSENLAAEFEVRRSTSQELGCGFIVRQPGSEDLAAEFCVVPQAVFNLGPWTEVDVAGDLEKTCIRVAFNSLRRDSQSHVHYDMGAGYWRDFELNFTFNFSDGEAGDATDRNYMHIILVSNAIGDFSVVTLGDVVTVYSDEVGATDDLFNFGLQEKTGGATDAFTEGAVNHAPGTYYCTLVRIRNVSITLNVYSDEARTTLIETINIASTGQSLRYIQATTATDAVQDPADHSSGYVERIWTSFSGDLACGFKVGTPGSENLPAEFEVRQLTSQDLPAEFEVSGITDASEDLPGEFISRQAGSQELPAEFIVRQPGSEDLPGEFIVRQPGSEDLPGEFIVRQPGSQDLAASFEGQVSLNLSAELIVRQPGSQDLPAEFIVRQAGSEDLPAEFIVRQPGSEDLPAEFIVRHPGSQDLAGEFISRQSGSQNLLGELIVRHPGSVELAAGFTIRRSTSLNLRMGFRIPWYSVDLAAKIYVRPTTSKATDFEVKDNKRGLTIVDTTRVMTVTPRRKMKVQ